MIKIIIFENTRAAQGKDQETKRDLRGRRYKPLVRGHLFLSLSPLVVVAPFNGHPSAAASVRLPIGPERGKTCVRERPLTNSCRRRRSFIIILYYYHVSCFFTGALAVLTGPARNVRFGYNGGGDDYYDDYDVKIDASDIIIIFASATAAHEI